VFTDFPPPAKSIELDTITQETKKQDKKAVEITKKEFLF
jgi:hypothetical protein